MEGYTHVYSSNNIISFDQVVFVLENAGIKIYESGRKALEIGNVELTGITGASISVPDENYEEARKLLVELGLASYQTESENDIVSRLYWILAIVLIAAVVYMIVIALM